jgi:hypothetical protein
MITILKNNPIYLLHKNKKILKYKCFKINEDEIPYVCNYYYDAKKTINDDIIIPLYVTDYYHSEYLYNDYSERFVIRYAINDEEFHYIENLQAGDYDLNIGQIKTKGENFIRITVIDSKNRMAHELFKSVYIIEEEESKVYMATEEDLNAHDISIDSEDDTDCTNTRLGFTSLFQEVKNNGYDKIILPTNTYRINATTDRLNAIKIPSQFTVDMNNSILKQQPSENFTTRMIEMKNCIDSHIINGVIEGDFKERYEADTLHGWDSEGMNCFSFIGNCKFCTMENMQVNYITGYALSTGDGGGYYAGRIVMQNACPNFISHTDINKRTGEEISSMKKCVSPMLDLSPLKNNGNRDMRMFNMSYMGGLLGTNSYDIYYHFYDSNKDFIETIISSLYRRIRMPKDAQYVRITLDAPELTVNSWEMQLTDYPVPTNCRYTNMSMTETRTCAFNPNHCEDLDISFVNLIRCAHDDWGSCPTPIPIDIEDGWMACHDIHMRNINLEKSPNASGGITVRTGINVQVIDCINIGAIDTGGSYCFISSGCSGETFYKTSNKEKVFTRYTVIENNNIKGGGSIVDTETNPQIIKNCIIVNPECTGTFNSCEFYNESDINESGNIKLSFTKSKLNNCYVHDIYEYSNRLSNSVFNNCKINNFKISATSHISFNDTELSNIDMRTETGFSFNQCDFINNSILYLDINDEAHDPYITEFNNCNININNESVPFIQFATHAYTKGTAYLDFINTTINYNGTYGSLIYGYAQPIKGHLRFDNCIINSKNKCNLFTSRLSDSIVDLKVTFENTQLDDNINIEFINNLPNSL